MVFVVWKALTLLPLLPVAIPLGLIYQFFSAINSIHTWFITFLHVTELFFWVPKLIIMTLLIPFIPLLWIFVHPPAVIAKVVFDIFIGFVNFFTYPVAYFVWMWHAFQKVHMHFHGAFMGVLKALNL